MASAMLELMTPELKELVLSFLNYAMMAGGSLVKLPQVVGILRTGTVKGMSEASLGMELLACICFCCYNFEMGHPFKTWGEMAMITLQCLVQTLLYWTLAEEKLAVLPRALISVGVVSGSFLVLTGHLPPALLPAFGLTPTILGAVARVPQIMLNFRQGHTGNQSCITWGMSFTGNCIRILTTLAAVSDVITLGGHLVAGVLNGTLIVQILFYWSNTMEVLHGKDKKKKA
eukprot:TRINITY_DN38599_c0_g1_i1.p2 TRINITY_DN38599_c0_g1~~TRINITY_DN38599_c0_g1_i1.p2  ORF type:complete len:230 (-),score=58.08 TRINITY_DN38599_c0_g1_i1:198-887(-)